MMSSILRQSMLDSFERIYVINLPHRTDRRASIEKQLGLLGMSLSDPEVILFEAVRPEDKGEWPSIGARGCFHSHLDVLKHAQRNGCRSVLLLEDDADWSKGFLTDPLGILGELRSLRWEFLHGGNLQDAGHPSFEPLAPETGMQTTHFIALRGVVIPHIITYLEAMAGRKRGDPNGGPMHVDGAYSWFRRDNPGTVAFVADPPIAVQRPSRTDIHDLQWFDRLPLVKDVVNRLRGVRAGLR
jgi:hypothetical protein